MKRTQKGQFGYMKSQRNIEILKTAALFLLSLSIYLVGLWSTGSNKNLLTIVAILGCLPASKCAVNMIMFIRYKGCSDEARNEIGRHIGDTPQLYDLVFTSYEKTYEVAHAAFKANTLVGYAQNSKCDASACEKHLQKMFAQDNIKSVSVKIFQDLPKYLKRLDQLKTLETAGTAEQTAEAAASGEAAGTDAKTEAVFSVLKSVSL